MGDIADEMLKRYGYADDDGMPYMDDYLDMTDDEIHKATATCRTEKLKSIRTCSHGWSNATTQTPPKSDTKKI